MHYQVLILDAIDAVDWTLPDVATANAAIIQAQAMAGSVWE
jgi:hypothetical protein